MHLLPSFNKGLGVVNVKGRNLSPFPPAMITASMGSNDEILFKAYTFSILPSLERYGSNFIPLSLYSLIITKKYIVYAKMKCLKKCKNV